MANSALRLLVASVLLKTIHKNWFTSASTMAFAAGSLPSSWEVPYWVDAAIGDTKSYSTRNAVAQTGSAATRRDLLTSRSMTAAYSEMVRTER
jgi:hypothetical protein